MRNYFYKFRIINVLISLGLFAMTLLIFLPGSYSIDSWSEYGQMISGQYDDWFGPALPFIWHELYLVTRSYVSLYFVQMFLYWVFFTLMVWHTDKPSFIYWLILAFSIFFCFIPQYIMRDSLMAICWGVASVMLFRMHTFNKYNKAIIIFLLLGIGLWIRPNGLIAIIPLIWALLFATGNRNIATWKYLLLSIGITFFLFISTQLLTYKALHTSKAYPTYKLKLLDITGISKLSGENYIPGCIRSFKNFNYDTLLKNYTPASFDDIYWPVNNRAPIVPYPNEILNSDVNKSWVSAILKHPLYYIQNRTAGFLYYLRINKRFKNNEYWNTAIWIDPQNPLHLKPKSNAIRDKFNKMYTNLYNTCIYDPWFWLLLNMVCFILFILKSRKMHNRYWQMHASIQLSGIIFMLSQFPVYQHDRDFRYTYWNVFVALIALNAILGIKAEKKIIIK